MSKTISRRARHRKVFVVLWAAPGHPYGNGGQTLAKHGAFLTHEAAVAWAKPRMNTDKYAVYHTSFEVVELTLHSAKKPNNKQEN